MSLLCPWVFAQRSQTVRTFSQALNTKPAVISSQLQLRALRTYVQASALERSLAHAYPASYPYTSRGASPLMIKKIPVQYAADFYPQMADILTTNTQLANYFTARNNREILKYAARQKQVFSKMYQSIPVLKQHKQSPLPPDGMAYLAQLVPNDTNYLLLGEIHETQAIQNYMVSFLSQLRTRFPQRKIFFFTEALPEKMKFTDPEFTKYFADASWLQPYMNLFKKLESQQITVIGLEPEFLFLTDDSSQLVHIGKLAYIRDNIWTSPEGIRLRNQRWKEILQTYKICYPDALFVVHGGFHHLAYTGAYSIGAFTKTQGNSFLIGFFPGYTSLKETGLLKNILKTEPWMKNYQLPQGGFLPVSDFDFATQGTFAQPLLQFTPQEAAITGFDVQIKIPVSLPQK